MCISYIICGTRVGKNGEGLGVEVPFIIPIDTESDSDLSLSVRLFVLFSCVQPVVLIKCVTRINAFENDSDGTTFRPLPI